MEEAPLQFIDTWNYWALIAAAALVGIGVLRVLFHFIKLASTKDYKA